MNTQALTSFPFDNKLFRKITNLTCTAIDPSHVGLQVISPFGFELLENKTFLNGNLRRFYCYIGVPADAGISLNETAHKFYEELSNNLRKIDNNFLNTVVLRILQDSFIRLRENNYVCDSRDKLIDIQCRYVKTSIIEDYANYIICSIQAIHENKDEPEEFLNNFRFRSRTYQIYAMLECLFGNLLSDMSFKQSELYREVFNRTSNAIDIFFDDNKLFTQANEDDIIILEYLIRPRISAMIKAIQSSHEYILIKTTSYHVKDELCVKMDKRIYNAAVKKIRTSYENFI